MYLPGESEWPRVDEYLDAPEVTRYERVEEGRRQVALPATAEHGDPRFHLDQLLGPHLAEGYVGSVDLKTRVNVAQEFASDTCVLTRDSAAALTQILSQTPLLQKYREPHMDTHSEL